MIINEKPGGEKVNFQSVRIQWSCYNFIWSCFLVKQHSWLFSDNCSGVSDNIYCWTVQVICISKSCSLVSCWRIIQWSCHRLKLWNPVYCWTALLSIIEIRPLSDLTTDWTILIYLVNVFWYSTFCSACKTITFMVFRITKKIWRMQQNSCLSIWKGISPQIF